MRLYILAGLLFALAREAFMNIARGSHGPGGFRAGAISLRHLGHQARSGVVNGRAVRNSGGWPPPDRQVRAW